MMPGSPSPKSPWRPFESIFEARRNRRRPGVTRMVERGHAPFRRAKSATPPRPPSDPNPAWQTVSPCRCTPSLLFDLIVAVLHRLGRDGQAHADLIGTTAIQQAQNLELPGASSGNMLPRAVDQGQASSGACRADHPAPRRNLVGTVFTSTSGGCSGHITQGSARRPGWRRAAHGAW